MNTQVSHGLRTSPVRPADHREFPQVQLPEQNPAGALQPLFDGGVKGRDPGRRRARPIGGRDLPGGDHVFQRVGDAVQWTAIAAAGQLRIGATRTPQSTVPSHRDERVEAGIDSVDPGEMSLGQRDRGDFALPQTPAECGDRSVDEIVLHHLVPSSDADEHWLDVLIDRQAAKALDLRIDGIAGAQRRPVARQPCRRPAAPSVATQISQGPSSGQGTFAAAASSACSLELDASRHLQASRNDRLRLADALAGDNAERRRAAKVERRIGKVDGVECVDDIDRQAYRDAARYARCLAEGDVNLPERQAAENAAATARVLAQSDGTDTARRGLAGR